MIASRIDQIHKLLSTALAPTLLEITDESHFHKGHAGAQTGRGHFAIKITSPHFAGKTLLQCHQLIYRALGNLLETDIHALRIEIITD